MDFRVEIKIISDTASPAIEKLTRAAASGQIARKLRDPLLNLVRDHYKTLPPNKNHWPTTGFWKKASDSTYAVDDDNGVTITTDQIGVRQRLFGGPIDAVRAKNLSIPACAEAYGKLPADFDNLAFIKLGRGQDAPRALIKISGDTSETKGKVMFWLTPHVRQSGDPNVLPNDDEIFSVVDEELKSLGADA